MNEKSPPSRAKSTISLVLSYGMSLILFLLVTVIVARFTLFSAEYHVRHIEKSGFADLAVFELNEKLISYGNATGVPGEVMSKWLNADLVTEAATASVLNMFGEGSRYDTQTFKNDALADLTRYAAAEGYVLDDEMKEGLDEIAQYCADIFSEYVWSNVHEMVVPYLLRYRSLLGAAIAGLSVLSLVLAVILVLLNWPRMKAAARYGFFAFAAAAVCSAAAVMAVRVSGIFDHLNITPQSYNKLFSSLFSDMTTGYWIAFAPLLVCAALCLSVCIKRVSA